MLVQNATSRKGLEGIEGMNAYLLPANCQTNVVLRVRGALVAEREREERERERERSQIRSKIWGTAHGSGKEGRGGTPGEWAVSRRLAEGYPRRF